MMLNHVTSRAALVDDAANVLEEEKEEEQEEEEEVGEKEGEEEEGEEGTVDHCDPDPCRNGAECITEIHTYICVCQLWYSGRTCRGTCVHRDVHERTHTVFDGLKSLYTNMSSKILNLYTNVSSKMLNLYRTQHL